MSSWTRSFRIDAAISAAAAANISPVARNNQLSRSEQAELVTYPEGRAAAARAAKPKGSHLFVTDVAVSVGADVHRRLIESGVGNFTSVAEITALAKDQAGLAPILLAARETARALRKVAAPLPVPVTLTTAVAGITLVQDGDWVELRVAKDVPVGSAFQLHIDGMTVDAKTFHRGWNAHELSTKVPADVGFSSEMVKETADGYVTRMLALRDSPGSLSQDEAGLAAQHAIVEHLKSVRAKDEDWQRYFPTDWPGMVARGVSEGILGFAANAEVRREADRYIFSGRGAFGLYTDVEVRKHDGAILRAYVEID
jgi:hypothetical protein